MNYVGECSDWSDECPTTLTGKIFSRNDIIANPFLRGLVWVMAFIAIMGNLVSFLNFVSTFIQQII